MTPEKARQKRIEKAAKEGRQFIPKKPTGIVAKDKAEWRREYKRMLRRKAGAKLRSDMKANADRKRKAADEKRSKRLHDSHVKRYHGVMYSRSKSASKYEINPNEARKRASKRRETLSDSYMIQNIKAMGIDADHITTQMILLKRESMEYRRISRTIKTSIKNQTKEDHETITKHT